MRLKRPMIAVLLPLVFLGACAEQAPAPVVFGHRQQATARPGTQAQPQAAPASALAPQPRSEVVEVQRGDTLYGIARKFNLPPRALIEANRLDAPYALRVGQKLNVPAVRYHTVRAGETLYIVSRGYGIDTFALAQANNLQPPYALTAGQQLRIPSANAADNLPVASAPRGGVAVETLPPPSSTAQKPEDQKKDDAKKEDTSNPAASPQEESQPAEVSASQANVPSPPPRAGRVFNWPVRGRILSGFGPKPDGLHNDGINIAANRGDPIYAAENGIVVYAGNELKGFGNLLLVRHADGWMTAYAHADRLLARKGDTVKRGQIIARVGQTGGVTSPQVHFEVRKGTQAVNPAQFLPTASLESFRYLVPAALGR